MAGKSDDSKRQDGAKAKAASQAGETVPVGEVLQGEAAERLEAGTVTREEYERLESKFASLGKALLALESQQKVIAAAPASMLNVPLAKRPICPTCNQVTSVCKGAHTTLRVLPKEAKYMQQFSGVRLNGVTYIGHTVVATSQVDTILSTIRKFENYVDGQQENSGRIRGWEREIRSFDAAMRPEPVDRVAQGF